LKRAAGLLAQLIAVADKQRLDWLAGVGDASQQIDDDERLARAGRKREQGAWRLALHLAAGDLLEHGADRSVLIVAASRLATLIAG